MLATDNFLFRVHKSVLAEHSSMFRDMFDIATPDCDELETLGGRTGTDISIWTVGRVYQSYGCRELVTPHLTFSEVRFFATISLLSLALARALGFYRVYEHHS